MVYIFQKQNFCIYIYSNVFNGYKPQFTSMPKLVFGCSIGECWRTSFKKCIVVIIIAIIVVVLLLLFLLLLLLIIGDSRCSGYSDYQLFNYIHKLSLHLYQPRVRSQTESALCMLDTVYY